MAPGDSDDTQLPRQLTLDEWADEMNALRPPPRTVNAAVGRNGRRAVVPSRGQSHPVAGEPGKEGAPDSSAGAQKDAAAPEAIEMAPTDPPAQHHPVTTELLAMPEALLTRTHLRDLGLERRAVDAVFRALPVVALPGYSRPMVRVEDYLKLVEHNTFRDDRIRPVTRTL
jgi:hypothetical protein